MATLGDMKLVATGDKDLNRTLTLGIIWVVGGLVCDVIDIFWDAYRERKKLKEKPKLRKKWIYFFLLLALVSLFAVNAIKIEHIRLQDTAWAKLEGETDGLRYGLGVGPKGSWIAQSSSKRRAIKRVANSLHARFYQPAERIQNFKDLVQRLLDEKVQRMGSGTLSKAFTNQIQDLTQEAQGVAAAENIWDNFKILVFTYRRFWWTQQWFTGYMAWAAYMAIECYHRSIRASAVLSFTLLGYVFGLSGMQCVFFVLLLLKPKIARMRPWMPHWVYTLVPFGFEAAGVVLLYSVLHALESQESSLLFNTLQAVLILIPPITQACIVLWPRLVMRNRGNSRDAKSSMAHQYFIASFQMAFAVHAFATTMANGDAGPDRGVRWPIGMPWKRNEPELGTESIEMARSVLNALGDHDWVSVIGVDVLLSAFALCCWAVAANLDARGMMGCSVFPWLSTERDTPLKAIAAPEDEYVETEEEFVASIPSARPRLRSASQQLTRRGSRRQDSQELENEGEAIDRPTMVRRGRPPKSTLQSRNKYRTSLSPVKRYGARQSSRLRERSRSRQRVDFEDDDEDSTDLDLAGPAEQAAVAWGVFALGGLGMASQAVFGSGEME